MFFIFWRGWGLVALVFLAVAFVVWVGLGALYRGALGITATNGWWNVVALLVGFGTGALANWLFAVRVVEPKFDRANGLHPVTSTLYFIPLRYWTFVILAIGLIFLVPNILELLR